MLGRTHFLFGLLLGILHYFSGAPFWTIFLIPIFSLLMDVDEKHSYVGRKAKVVGWAFMHRGFFHSIWFIILSVLIAREISNHLAASVLIAYIGHLLLDGVTKAGIRPFWPLRLRLSGPVRVGKWEEHVFLILIVAGIVYLIA